MSLSATASHFTIIAPTATLTILEITVGLLMGYGSLCFIDRVKRKVKSLTIFLQICTKLQLPITKLPTPSPRKCAWSALGGFFLQIFY